MRTLFYLLCSHWINFITSSECYHLHQALVLFWWHISAKHPALTGKYVGYEKSVRISYKTNLQHSAFCLLLLHPGFLHPFQTLTIVEHKNSIDDYGVACNRCIVRKDLRTDGGECNIDIW